MSVRIQIELDDDLAKQLEAAAKRRGVDPGTFAHDAVLLRLLNERLAYSDEAKRRALAAVGRFSSGLTDISEEHDKYLDEIYGDCLR